MNLPFNLQFVYLTFYVSAFELYMVAAELDTSLFSPDALAVAKKRWQRVFFVRSFVQV